MREEDWRKMKKKEEGRMRDNASLDLWWRDRKIK